MAREVHPPHSMDMIYFYEFILTAFLLLCMDFFSWQRHCLRIYLVYLLSPCSSKKLARFEMLRPSKSLRSCSRRQVSRDTVMEILFGVRVKISRGLGLTVESTLVRIVICDPHLCAP